MVRVQINQAVHVRVEILAVHALVVSAGDEVPEVAVDAVGEEELSVVVVVEAPRIGRAVSDGFEDLARRMIAPDAAVDFHALLGRRAGRADVRGRHENPGRNRSRRL